MSRYHWLLGLLGERLIRLLWLLPLAMVGLFTLIRLAPVDPVQAYVGARVALVGPEQRAAIAKAWGLNDPVPEQFLRWLSHLLKGDFGDSMLFNAPVGEVIMARWPASLSLIGSAFIFAFVIGTSLGLIAAASKGRWPDRIIRGFAVTLAVSPGFWLALMFIALFSVQLGWLPACCSASPGLTLDEVTLGDRLRHLILPAITVSIVGIAPLILHTRARARAFLEGPAARHLKAHGARDLPLLIGSGLRHALGPALTVHLAGAGELIGGSVLAESVFSWPGLGEATVRAAKGADAPLLMGVALATLGVVFLGNMLADICAYLLDPRLRNQAGVGHKGRRWARMPSTDIETTSEGKP
ncbi:peptide/nickel transport system permease protein [Cohaesibacter sp. ES.047]|uniref:ABC transporter permease n=1 Tax=Cohaesibacter sp. ES.047 TaxID=1798205 RepID=UPI000BB8FE6D|nr:ABC transporter permease [Cohaesibacter sp. ES.047]SNY91994.1 peptide/nickel transport system permease protein [Cohaesibacter sp. ES.047]